MKSDELNNIDTEDYYVVSGLFVKRVQQGDMCSPMDGLDEYMKSEDMKYEAVTKDELVRRLGDMCSPMMAEYTNYESLWKIPWTKEDASAHGLPLDYKIKHADHKPAWIECMIPAGTLFDAHTKHADIIRVIDFLEQTIEQQPLGGEA